MGEEGSGRPCTAPSADTPTAVWSTAAPPTTEPRSAVGASARTAAAASPPSRSASLMVIKRSGVTEPFSRNKVIAGVRKACQGRPVTEDALAQLGQRVEEAVRATGSAELSTHDVGLAILGPLQDLDLVAYLRFASVYRAFDSLEDFESGDHGAARAVAPQYPRRARRGPRRPRARGRRLRRLGAHEFAGAPLGAEAADNTVLREEPRTSGRFARIGRRNDRDDERPGTRFAHQGVQGEQGSACRAHPHHPRRASVRRGGLGAPRRRHDELARRLDQLRAARRGVPRLLVGERGQHRHQQVLPRRGRQPAAREEPEAADRPGGAHVPQGR